VYGIYAEAGCDVAIERNVEIKGGPEARTTRAIACVDGAKCTIQRNDLIEGAVWALTQSVGVFCGQDSCRDISGNLRIVGSRTNGESIGMLLDQSGPTVRGNVIEGGCGPSASVGVELNHSYARLVNNIITPGACAGIGAISPVQLYGIRQINGPTNEPHIHSNTIDGGRSTGTCTGRAVSILAATAGIASGVYRNNILHAGLCTTRYGIQELTPLAADPRVVENNAFWNATAGQYLDEGTTAINLEGAIDGLADIVSAGNLVRDPGFVAAFGDVHLASGSACIDRGTTIGLPPNDYDGDSRPLGAGPDIGADERE
jgi:hypothetical protein